MHSGLSPRSCLQRKIARVHVGPQLWCEKLESSLEMHSVVTGGLVCHFDSNPRAIERRVVWPSWTAQRR